MYKTCMHAHREYMYAHIHTIIYTVINTLTHTTMHTHNIFGVFSLK